MKSHGNDSLFGIKRGKAVKKCQKHAKNMIFSRELIVYESKSLVFESDSLESQANESRHSFLQRDESNSLTVAFLS